MSEASTQLRPLVVGLGHRRRMGKDAAASILYSTLQASGHACAIRYFAGPLKRICHELYGWAGLEAADHYDKYPADRDRILPAIGKSPREIWIDFGTPAVRGHVWDASWSQYLIHHLPGVDVVLVPDLRFPNEIEAIREVGGLVFKVDRPGIPHSSDAADSALAEFAGWDGLIENQGNLTYLQNYALSPAIEIIKQRLIDRRLAA